MKLGYYELGYNKHSVITIRIRRQIGQFSTHIWPGHNERKFRSWAFFRKRIFFSIFCVFLGFFLVQAALVIHGLFLCKFAYSHRQKESKITIFQSKLDFLSANSRFAVQNGGPYLPRITMETCNHIFFLLCF